MTTAKDKTKEVPGLDEVMSSSEPLKMLAIQVGEKEFTISYRSLSWLNKSACVAVATELFINNKGEPQTMFHIDIYFLEVLKKILVDFPWPVSDKILNDLTPEIGDQLQAIIPSPLGESPTNLADGSQKPSKGQRKTRSSKGTP